ncbi:MAG: hypothetical protein IK066_04870 [Kiritimatiellae bacterium]|nr:hypothetical protein [Kiritimatiellia bacterium]
MKRNLIAMCCVAALACAGTASADVLAEDSAANYTEETFVSGANLGSGFGAWEFWNAAPTLADSAAGVCGDINSEENGVSFRFARSADNEWCNGYRGFANALNAGDTLTFRFTCAYCGGHRGLDLFANGGHGDDDKVANVIDLYGDNQFSVNGTVISTEWAPNAVTEVSVIQETDGVRIAVARTTPDESGAGNVAYWTKVETDKKLTGIGLYAGGWDWNDGADVENYAFYVNDLKIEGTPPTDTLSLDGPWAVAEKEAELSFKVTRQNSEGTLDVTLASSYHEFASVPATVTFADGETEVPFTVTAALQGRGNVATISASAEGVAGASFEVKGPNYRINNGSDDPVQFFPDQSADIWINWDGGARDDSKLSLAADPEGVISVPTDWALPAEDNYVQSSVTGLAPGSAALVLSYDDVEMARCTFTVRADSLALAGPVSVRAGDENVKYTLTGVFSTGSGSANLSLSGDATITYGEFSPSTSVSIGELVTDTPVEFFVTFGDATAPVTLSVSNDDGLEDSLEITVTEAPDYSKYIAYDDASLYTVGLDYNAVGEGTEKFKGWKDLYKNADGETRFAGATLVSGAGDASVLTDDKAFAVYANGDDGAEIQLLRPFQNSLGDGQEFSVVLSPNFRDGTKGVKFLGEWEGTWYPRAEFFYNNDGYFYKLDGDENATSLDWGFGTDAVTLALKKAADGSGYTLAISRGDEVVAKEGITSFKGSVDGVLFYSWNGGDGDENNLVFNSLAIEQVEEPIVVRNIWWVSGVNNPDAAGEYTFTIGASTDDIGEVVLAIEPADGAASLSAESIDLTDVTEASFTVTLSEAVAGDKFTVTATPVDTEVGALSYDIYPIDAWLHLKSDGGKWEFTTDDEEIWMFAEASPANYGTYDLAITGDEGVLELSVDSVTVPGEGDEYGRFWFNVYIKGAGEATVYLKDYPNDEDKRWGFKIYAGDTRPELPAPAVVTTSDNRRGLAWKLEDLDSTYFLGAYSLLGDVAWTHLEQGKDFVIENEQLIVLFDGDFFKDQRVGFVTFGEIPPPPIPQ